MAVYTITVTDTTGAVVHETEVDTSNAGSNADDAELTEVQKAMYLAAPEVCPWDCEYCRG